MGHSQKTDLKCVGRTRERETKNKDNEQIDGVRIRLVSKIREIHFSTCVRNRAFY